MIEGFLVDEHAVYDDPALQVSLGLSAESLAKARRAGELKYTRKGRRILYLGRWILDWFDQEAEVQQASLNASEGALAK